MATTASETKVQELYIAYFGRPADPAGLAFYADALDAASTTVEAIATSFAASTEAATIVALDTDAYLSAVYLQAFGRAYVEGTDGTFWKDAINNAATTKELAMVQILEGASGTDTTAVANKVTVAKTYTAAVTADSKDYSGDTAAAAAKAVLDAVTEDAATVTSGNTAAQTAVDGLSSTTSNPGSSFALTTDADTVFGTTGDDTITAANLTLTAGDLIVDSSSTDNDTLTIATASDVDTSSGGTDNTIVGIENVVINQTTFAAIDVDLDGVSSSSVTLNQLQAGAAASVNADNASGTLTFGTGLTAAAVVTQKASDLTINAGSTTGVAVTGGTTGALVINAGALTTTASGVATTGSVTISGDALATTTATGATTSTTTAADTSTLNVTGTAAATDVATVSIGAAAGVVNTNVETLNVSSATTQTADAVATVSGTAATTYNVTGDKNVVIAGTAAMFSGKTLTDSSTATSTVQIATTGGTADLTLVAADVIDINATTASTYTVANNQAVTISGALATGSVIDSTALTTGDETLNLTVTANPAAEVTVSDFELVNVISGGTTANVVDLRGSATTTAIVASGAQNLTFDATSVAKSLVATDLTGVLAATAGAATIATITGGSGNDVITLVDGDAVTVVGGAGTDTLTLAATAVVNAATFSGFEVVTGTASTVDFLASQLHDATFAVTTITGLAINEALSIDTTTIDLSGIQSASLATTVIDGSKVTAQIALGTALTFTGTSVADTVSFSTNSGNNVVSTGAGADVITTGAGNDTITAGEGTDTITAGAGVDTIILTETTAVTDTVVTTSGAAYSATNIDSITGFTAGTGGDVVSIDISDAILVTGTTDLVGAVASTTITAGSGTVEEQVVATGGTITATTEVTVMTGGTFADNAALIQAITSDGTVSTSDLAWANNNVGGDAFVLVYSDGTDTHVVSVADAGTDTTLEVADLTVTNLVTLSGIASIDASDFVTANFAFA